jgi:hypothetical protein
MSSWGMVGPPLMTEGEDRGLDPVLQIEFGEDAADVSLDGLLANYQFASNLAVAVPAGDEVENLAFARREGLERVEWRWAAECAGEPGHQVGVEVRAPGGRRPDGSDNVLGCDGLKQAGCSPNLLIVRVGRCPTLGVLSGRTRLHANSLMPP